MFIFTDDKSYIDTKYQIVFTTMFLKVSPHQFSNTALIFYHLPQKQEIHTLNNARVLN